MELHQLKVFAMVVQEASFTRAARALHLTQPAVSQQIRNLEETFGLELLIRAGKSVRPSGAGEVLLEYAHNLLALAARGEAALAAFQTEKRGRLNLGAGNTTITFRLPQLLREYKRLEASVELIVHAGNSADLLVMLEQGQLDLALVTSPGQNYQLQTTPLYSDEIVLILPKDHPLGEADPLTSRDLSGLPSILFARGSGYRRFLDEAFAASGYQPEVVMELDSIEGIKQLVQIGLGLSFLPRIAVEQELNSGGLLTRAVVGLVPTLRTTYAVYRRAQFTPMPLRSFLELLSRTYHNPL